MNPVVILFRQNAENLEEYNIASKFFDIETQRTYVDANSLVIPRYSALPFFKELQCDVETLKSRLINSEQQFNYIANFEYYEDIKAYTFPTYFDGEPLPETAFVVKGKTNSRKQNWETMCFAKDKRRAIEIACDLREDSLIGQQDIIFREYQPLKTFEILIHGLPVTNEWRVFFYKSTLLSKGYYWSNAEYPEKGVFAEEAGLLAQTVANVISESNNFFTIDVAEKENGEWIVVEINSGEMSGLSLNDPRELYSNLKLAIEKDK